MIVIERIEIESLRFWGVSKFANPYEVTQNLTSFLASNKNGFTRFLVMFVFYQWLRMLLAISSQMMWVIKSTLPLTQLTIFLKVRGQVEKCLEPVRLCNYACEIKNDMCQGNLKFSTDDSTVFSKVFSQIVG